MIAAGVEEFNRGAYWEAHERWEQVWRVTADPNDRAHLKGMIQAAGAFVLLAKGRTGAAARVARRALHHLTQFAPSRKTEFIVIAGLLPLLDAITRCDQPGAPPAGNPPALAALLSQAANLRARIEKPARLA